MKNRMRIQILQNKNRDWYWRITARNGKILAHSESYSSYSKALQTAEAVSRHYQIELEDEGKRAS